MAVTSFKLASAGRSDRRKRITESYSSMIENRQMISRAVTAHLGPFSLRGRKVAIDNVMPYITLAMERSMNDWMKTAGK